jgi:transcription elongation factor GreA
VAQAKVGGSRSLGNRLVSAVCRAVKQCQKGAGVLSAPPNKRRQRSVNPARYSFQGVTCECCGFQGIPREGLYLNDKETILTPEGLAKLQNELDELKTVHRREVNDRIRQAKEYGDLSENAEYEDAKQEQAFIEGRILKLEAMIRNSRIIDESDYAADEVHFGSSVKVKDLKNSETYEFHIVGSAEADPSSKRISNESPLGRALIGHKKGETVDVSTPRGVVKYKIEAIKSANGTAKKTTRKAS